MMRTPAKLIVLSFALLLLAGARQSGEEPALKDIFSGYFHMGAALGPSVLREKLPEAQRVVEKHFSSITPENDMKWERIHPQANRYNFTLPDYLVDLGEKQQMFVVGHTLVWHNQTPAWVFHDEQGNLVSRDTLLARMSDHIFTVMTRYRGKVHGYDVVNEAITDQGGLRESLWHKIIGDDYIEHAFRFAHEADPKAELYYNDFSLASPSKREGCIQLVKNLQSKGIHIDGVGMQGHYDMSYPDLNELEKSIVGFSELGVKVMITELDISVLPWPDLPDGAEVTGRFTYRPELDPYKEEFPDSAQQELALRYADIFRIFVKHSDKISRITFWGVNDGTSWKNNFPVRGRTDFPLLFDRNYQCKPAFHAVCATALNPVPLSRGR
jgi:endo-1,4-beta-xylanase